MDVRTEEEAREAYSAIVTNVESNVPEAKIQGVYVTRQIPQGEEVIIGMKQDPSFGPVILFGLGGIFVEIFRDISFRVAPLTRQEALEMVRQSKAYRILAGARGRPPKDVAAIVDALLRVSQLALDHPEIREMDINPLIVLDEGEGCRVADAKVFLGDGGG